MAAPELRNVAIIAHVDHGKTTLVDAMLWQTGAFRSNAAVNDRVMDSMDLEREKGITILAKNTAVTRGEVKLNIVDTPGHADFGGEVERALAMVDGVILLVDAAEGPLPQTRFVLRKALADNLPVILVVNKVDRPDARIEAVVDEVLDLLIDLDAHDDQLDLPVLYAAARDGWASVDPAEPTENLDVLFSTLLEHIPAPDGDAAAPLRAQVTNLDADPYVGRLALCRIHDGVIERGQPVAWCRADGSVQTVRIGELYVTEQLDRVPVDRAGPGEIIAVAGIDEITIGETLTDVEAPRPFPVITVDEPSLSATIGVNNSPMAGREGNKLTARLLRARLDQELVGNVSMRVNNTDRPDVWEVQARGELALAILVETMRREGFELTVGKPEVVTREVDGAVHEPIERLTIDVPEEHVGAVTQMMGPRQADLTDMTNHGSGWVRLDYLVPARGLIGFRTAFLTETRGTGLAHSVFERYDRWKGDLRSRASGSLVADRPGASTPFALINLQERATMLVEPGAQVYTGMIVGENSRGDDMDVNITKEKKQTNMRAAGSDETVKLTRPQELSLEQALEFIAADECVEVTPSAIRLRKVTLDATTRARDRKKSA